MKKISLLAIFLLILFSSCSKGSNPDDENNKTLQLLTQKPWYRTKVEFKRGVEEWINDHTLSQCELDDSFEFKKDKSLVWDRGAFKCEPNEDQFRIYTWVFSDNSKSIIVDDNVNEPEKWEILVLDSKNLVVLDVYLDDNITVQRKMTFIRK